MVDVDIMLATTVSETESCDSEANVNVKTGKELRRESRRGHGTSVVNISYNVITASLDK